jgi:ABC-type nitrate/sulfonate/bicarbonate transport system ATPase subunit
VELVVKNIKKEFYFVDHTVDFCLNIPKISFPVGKITFILGKMGSGKSLFLRLLNNEESNTQGKIQSLLNGQNIENNISIVRQNVSENLCAELTVEENIILRLKPKTLKEKLFPKKEYFDSVTRLLSEHKEILKKREQPCDNLSGGQKQTLAFVANTITKSSILCLDEFLSSTDFQTSKQLREQVKNYAKENNSVVIVVSHDFKIALEDADLIYIFKNGAIKKRLKRDTENWNEEYIIKQMND